MGVQSDPQPTTRCEWTRLASIRVRSTIATAIGAVMFAFSMPACSSLKTSDKRNQERPLFEATAIPADDESDSVPAFIQNLVGKTLPVPDVIRGFWFVFPYDPEPGPRVWIQTASSRWVERWPSGHTNDFLPVGRYLVQEQPGSLLLKIHGAPYARHLPEMASFRCSFRIEVATRMSCYFVS